MSTTAVSQAVNGTGRISETTRRRVLDAAAELGWTPPPRPPRCAGPGPVPSPSWCAAPPTSSAPTRTSAS
ncbi:helix-turn-helix domain-containing protein [Streptomyces sp. M19]